LNSLGANKTPDYTLRDEGSSAIDNAIGAAPMEIDDDQTTHIPDRQHII